MKAIFKWLLDFVFQQFSLLNILVFESNPDYSCNTYPVFQELRRRLPNYRMVWRVTKGTPIISGVNDICYFEDETLKNSIKWSFYWRVAKAFISCNRYNESFRKDQLDLFLTHGCKTKNTRGKYNPGIVVDYINIQSHFFDEVTCYGYRAEKKQLVYLGYPRCDWLFAKNDIEESLKEIGVDGDFLIWLPTFRKSKNYLSRNIHSQVYDSLGIPLIYSLESLRACNEFLKKHKLHIIYKPHPIQDISKLTSESLSHIHVVNDKVLADCQIQLYQVIAASKALITDYSSVYFDYLLLDRPIATTIDDLELWKNAEGFAFDLERLYKCSTDQIATLDELYSFIQSVIIDGKDDKKAARKKILDETIMYQDGYSAKRVADFVLKKIGEQ